MNRRERDWGHDNTGVDLAAVPDEVCVFCSSPIHEEVVRFRAKAYHVECLVSFGFKAGRETAPAPIQSPMIQPGAYPYEPLTIRSPGTLIYTIRTDTTTSGTSGLGTTTTTGRSDHRHGNSGGFTWVPVSGTSQ
jgi:hypothetical protein